MKLVDLSTLIESNPESTPAYLRTEIAYSTHAEVAAQAQAILVRRRSPDRRQALLNPTAKNHAKI